MDWGELINGHGAALVLYARQWAGRHDDAEEAVQDGFVRLWRSDVARDKPREELVPLLFVAVKRAAQDICRSRERRSARETKASELLYDAEPMFERDGDEAERAKLMEQAIAMLPPEQREVLVLKVWGGLTFKMIAEALDVPQNTAASRYRYALAELRKQLVNVENV